MGCCCGKGKNVQRLSDEATKWPMPYLSKLEGHTIHSGQSIIIRGKVLKKTRFDISLSTGANVEGERRDDIVLQLSNRVDKNEVILNSLHANEWGKEIKYKSDFAVGKTFDYRLRIHDGNFQIFCNHQLLGSFDYRLALESISHIYVTGDIELYNVSWEGKYYKLPYEAMIPGNFTAGRRLYVSGQVEPKSKGFAITLYAGSDVAFLFNPRFDNKAVVRNSQLKGTWGKEEKGGKFPFSPDRTFDVVLSCENDHFKCFVNDLLYCTFKHRIESSKIDKLSIDGEIDFQSVHLK